jgi:hypothetical protein
MAKTVKINEAFKCIKCGEKNPVAARTCRDHCRKCLYSLHVDLEVPGDRLSTCNQLMAPIYIDQNGKKGYKIVSQCIKCSKIIPNIVADDDNMDLIIQIATRQNLENIPPPL